MANIIIVLILLLIGGLAVSKIVSEKRKGAKCIGCPHSGKGKKGNCSC